MKIVPTPGSPPIVHLPTPRERRDAPQDPDSRREALDLSSIRSLEKGTTGITPTEMERADRAIQSARETVKGEEKSAEWQERFDQVFELLTRKMGITPPLATDIANAILFVPTADDTDREEAAQTDETDTAETDTAETGSVDKESSADDASSTSVSRELYHRFVVTNPALRRLAGEARANDAGDEIAFASPGDLESALDGQQAAVRKMEAVAIDLMSEPAAPVSGETESPARP